MPYQLLQPSTKTTSKRASATSNTYRSASVCDSAAEPGSADVCTRTQRRVVVARVQLLEDAAGSRRSASCRGARRGLQQARRDEPLEARVVDVEPAIGG